MVASRIYPDDKPDHDSAVPLGTSKNLLRGHLLHLRASLCKSKAACLGAISAPLATVFRSPPLLIK